MKQLLTSLTLLIAMLPASATKYLSRSGWSWSASSICATGADPDIAGLGGMYDGDTYTCWHSNYFAQSGTPERSNPHWVQIDRGTDNSVFDGLAYLPRQTSDKTACTRCFIYLRDVDMSSTPATSEADIISALGAPDYIGIWTGNSDEKFAQFEKSSSARYILFVNIESNGSSSAACSEMNLFTGTPSEGSGGTSSSGYNAIRITPKDSSEPHRIAILGNSLSMSMSFDCIRLSNSDITVEYPMDEVEKFNFESYNFSDDESYIGDKQDVLTSTFTVNVSPAAGRVTELHSITLNIAETWRLNPTIESGISITNDAKNILSINSQSLEDYRVDNGYTISGLNITSPGEYTLTIPAEQFINGDGARSEAVNHVWTITGEEDSINELNADCPTITFAREGNILTIGGITFGTEALLYDLDGHMMLSAPVVAGRATFNTSSLSKGAYLLNINSTTLKIIL